MHLSRLPVSPMRGGPLVNAGTLHLLGRRSTLADAVALQRTSRKAFVRLVPIRRGWLVFELREAQS